MFHHDCLFCFHLDGDEVTHEFPWWPIIFGFPSNITGNRTLDVFHKNCVNDFDPVACTRSGLLSLLSLVTALFCAVRIFELHSPVQTNYHKLFVFYVLFLQSLLGSLEWLFGWKTQLALFSLYTRALALLIICHLYFTVACRVMNWTHDSTRRIRALCLTLIYFYYTILVLLGLAFAMEPWHDCHAPYWVWMSGGNVILVQLILVSLVLIVWRMHGISALENLRRSRAEVCLLLWAFETSAFVDLGYHITLLLLADEEKGCSGIFHHNQWHYTVVKVPYELISFLLPIWIVLLTFRSPQKSRTETGSVSHTSIFDNPHVEAVSDFVTVRNWRRRYRPLGGSHWAYVNPLSQITGRSRRTPRVRPGTSGEVGRLRQRAKSADANKLHRSVSAPTIVQTRQPTSGCAMITSPLDPIPEEVHSSCTSESVSASNSTIDSLTSVGTSGRPATAKKS